MTKSPAPPDDWSWEAMIESFRALGGVVKNIALGEHGLFALDPAEPVLVRVPPDLLIRTDHIALEDQDVVLDESAGLADPARQFFVRYANAVGVHAARRAEVTSFVEALSALPGNVREVLTAEFGLAALLQRDTGRAIRGGILQSRQIVCHGGRVIAPIIELARYDPKGLSPERGTSLQIQGYVKGEVFVRFGPQDAFSAFRLFGRAVPEAAAFSLPATVTFKEFQFDIDRRLSEGTTRGKDRVPNISRKGGKVSLSYLLLGQRNFPALPRSLFRALLSEAGIDDPDEAFDRIVRSNALAFIRLLQSLEPHEGEMITTLRTMARFQLEAMNHCMSSREIRGEGPVCTA